MLLNAVDSLHSKPKAMMMMMLMKTVGPAVRETQEERVRLTHMHVSSMSV